MAVLQKIIDMMDGLDAQKLGPKKPDATVIDIHGLGGKPGMPPEGSDAEEKGESPAFEAKEDAGGGDPEDAKDGGADDDEELMQKLRDMYSKVK